MCFFLLVNILLKSSRILRNIFYFSFQCFDIEIQLSWLNIIAYFLGNFLGIVILQICQHKPSLLAVQTFDY